MAFTYGKQIDFVIRFFAGTDPVKANSLVSARIYDSMPSTSQRTDHAAALGGFEEEVTTWTVEGDYKYKIVFAAIDDPDQTDLSLYDTWYVVVNPRLESAEQIQHVMKPVLIWRLTGQLWQIEIEAVDVYTLDSAVERAVDEVDVYHDIRAAQDFVLHKVKYLELDRHRLKEYDLSLATKCKATELCLRGMANRDNDYGDKADYWQEEYEKVWKETKPGYDQNDNGVIAPAEKVSTQQSIRILR